MHDYLLSLCWLAFENQGINPVGDNAQVTEYLHKQTQPCTQRDKGVVNPFRVTTPQDKQTDLR